MRPDQHAVARTAFCACSTFEELVSLTKIGHRFLVQIKELVDFEEVLAAAGN